MFTSFLPSLLHSHRALLLCHRWRMNKFSNFKTRRRICVTGKFCLQQLLLYRKQACWKTRKPETTRMDSKGLQPIKTHYSISWPWTHKRTRRGVGGAAAPPGLKSFRANSVFRASASCPKILNDKKYLNTVKIFRATLFFRATLVFSGQAQVAQKSWM